MRHKAVKKSQPTASSVHVDSMLGDDEMERFAKAFNDFNELDAPPTAPALPPADSKATPRSEAAVGPDVANLEAEVQKGESYGTLDEEGYGPEGDPLDNEGTIYGMQEIVKAIDTELLGNDNKDKKGAVELALSNLEKDKDHYRGEGEESSLKLDLGSGPAREPGHIGFDLYPHDHGTVVHDLNMGIPVGDESASHVRLVNSLEHMGMEDHSPLLNEVQRVLKPGGEFFYEGPDEISRPDWDAQYPGLVLTSHESTAEPVQKEEGRKWVKQSYTRIAIPDAATSNDAQPRIGIYQDPQLPDDSLLAADALGYDWSDATSSAQGNREAGYPSQGALSEKEAPEKRKKGEFKKRSSKVQKSTVRRVATIAVKHGDDLLMGLRRDNESWTVPGGHANDGEEMHKAALRELEEESGIKANGADLRELSPMEEVSPGLFVQPFILELKEKPTTSMLSDPDGEVYRWRWVDVSKGIPEKQASAMHVPIERNSLMKAMGLSAVERVEKLVRRFLGRKVPVRKADMKKQVAYCVVLTPEELDDQDDWMTAEDIEDAAHSYLMESRTIGSEHGKAINAKPVESYIAPQDMQWDSGPYGPQTVKKGSWVIGIKVLDSKEWQKVLDGDYQGVSVGGFGLRD